MPRILQLCAVDFTAKHFVIPLADFLIARGCEVHLGCTPGSYFTELRQAGYAMFDLPVARSTNLLRHYQSYRRLLRHLRENKYDIVHAHTPIASFIGRQAATAAGVPARFYTAHGFYFHDATPPLKRRLHVLLERHFARRCDHIFTVSSEDRETAIAEGIAPPEKLTYIGQGVDAGRFDPARFTREERLAARGEFGIPSDATVVAITGRLVREKGYFELIAAARLLKDRLPQLYFLAIGDVLESDYDGVKPELRGLVARHGLERRFIFAGLRGDVERLLAASDIFTLPSYREGMPVSILEAMALALPCVVTDIRGSREEVVESECGYIVPPRDAAALAERLGRLAADPELIRKMGGMARRRVLEHFRFDHYTARQWAVYQRYLK